MRDRLVTLLALAFVAASLWGFFYSDSTALCWSYWGKPDIAKPVACRG